MDSQMVRIARDCRGDAAFSMALANVLRDESTRRPTAGPPGMKRAVSKEIVTGHELSQIFQEVRDMPSSVAELELLQRAARKGRHDLVASLIMNGADINGTDASGHTAAHQAARNGHIHVLDVLHALGADLGKCSQRGVSIAHQAAFGGHVQFLERLVALGVRVDRVDDNDWTPLEVAHRAKRWAVVDYLEKIYSEERIDAENTSTTLLDNDLINLLPLRPLPREDDEDLSQDEMHRSSQQLHSLLPFGLLTNTSPTSAMQPQSRKRKLDAGLPSTPLPPGRPTLLHPPIASPAQKRFPSGGVWTQRYTKDTPMDGLPLGWYDM
ncbi:hypothetical protein AC1031_021415 [Aphanomyces cochlioides]|nr:hypothetical protein AC1031_021415 [Aphanomyces cochlioides]